MTGSTQTYETEYGEFTWHPDPHACPHANEHACPTCDFDGYYQKFIRNTGGGFRPPE